MKTRTKQNLLRLFTACLLSVIILASCEKDKSEDITPPVTEDELVGIIKEVKTLDPAVTYTITGSVIVEDGAVLNIPAGTMIKAKKGFNNYILVLQGGKINVQGTADKPVTMTADIDNAEPGHWGGLIINGKAPLSGGTIGSTEISSTYQYGGSVPDDNSGNITYLILAYTGARSSARHNCSIS